MKNLFFLLASISLALPALAQPIVYVTVAGSGNGSGNSWTNSLPGTELASRVATAPSGTQFWVTAGIYKPTTTTNRMASFSIASGVSVFGGFSGAETQLDQRNFFQNKTILSGDIGLPYDPSDHAALPASLADNSYHVVYFQDVDENTQINGLTVSGGVANLANGPTSYLLGEGVQPNDIGKTGGGVHNISITKCSTPALINCTIEQNRASFGSGLYSSGLSCSSESQLRIVNCLFRANESFDLGSGGGIYIGTMSNALIRGCVFADNQSFWGGGIFIFNCNPQLINCEFRNNLAGFNSGGSGGGTFIDAYNQSSSPSFYNCLFTGNQATGGGAVFNGSFFNGTSNPEFINCSFTQNIAASYSGGAIAIQDSVYSDGYNKTSSVNLPHPSFRSCILWNNTSYKNESISFGFNAFPAIRNSIVGGNFLMQDYTNVPPGYNAGNNLNADPLFIDPAGGNFRLNRQSPAVNAGDPDTSGLPATDLVGQARIQDGRVDMGPYESPACLPTRCVPIVIQRVR